MASNTVLRKYPGSDANLLTQANLNRSLLQANLAAFTAEDATMDAAYATAYATDITEAEDTVSDEQVKAILQGKTETVKLAAKAIAAKVKQLRYYVLEAFPADREVHNEFGLDRWDKARKDQDATLRFMTAAHQTAVKYQTQLTAKGYGATRTAALLTAREAMEEANNQQEQYKSGIPKLSALRVIEFNEVYDRIMRVNALAQIVYAADPEMAQQFVFDPGTTNTPDYEGTLAASETRTIATIPYAAAQVLQLRNVGDTLIRYRLRVSPDDSAPTHDVPAGDVLETTMAALNPAPGTLLTVQNMEAAEGAYAVEVV